MRTLTLTPMSDDLLYSEIFDSSGKTVDKDEFGAPTAVVVRIKGEPLGLLVHAMHSEHSYGNAWTIGVSSYNPKYMTNYYDDGVPLPEWDIKVVRPKDKGLTYSTALQITLPDVGEIQVYPLDERYMDDEERKDFEIRMLKEELEFEKWKAQHNDKS